MLHHYQEKGKRTLGGLSLSLSLLGDARGGTEGLVSIRQLNDMQIGNHPLPPVRSFLPFLTPPLHLRQKRD